jgi:hypothetical protein
MRKAEGTDMHTRRRAAFMPARLAVLLALLLTSCVFLTGLTMPDAPRPERRAKSPVQTFVEERTAKNQQAQSPARTQKKPNAAQVRQEDAASTAQRRHPPDRSARIVLPSKQLR